MYFQLTPGDLIVMSIVTSWILVSLMFVASTNELVKKDSELCELRKELCELRKELAEKK